MNRTCTLLMIALSLTLGGCYQFVAEHPEKSKLEFQQDQAECEQLAREYTLERRERMTHTDEIDHSRRCMRNRGWVYHFRKTSADTPEDKN